MKQPFFGLHEKNREQKTNISLRRIWYMLLSNSLSLFLSRHREHLRAVKREDQMSSTPQKNALHMHDMDPAHSSRRSMAGVYHLPSVSTV